MNTDTIGEVIGAIWFTAILVGLSALVFTI